MMSGRSALLIRLAIGWTDEPLFGVAQGATLERGPFAPRHSLLDDEGLWSRM